MVLNKRERTTAIVVGVGLLLIGLYVFGVEPFLAYRDSLATQERKVEAQRAQMAMTLTRAKSAQTDWNDLLASSLKDNTSEAQIQAENVVYQLAQSCQVTITGMRPESAVGADDKSALQPTTFRLTGTGTFKAVSQLLYELEEPKFPVKVTSVNLTAQKPGVDALQVQLALATVSYNKDAVAAAPRPRPAAAGAGSE